MKSVSGIANRDVRVAAPPAKAHTLRALIISALADGRSVIRDPLLGEDQRNVIECLRGLGVEVTLEPGVVIVEGRGAVFSPVADTLDVGESGVGMNFLTSAASFCDRPITLTGCKRITERPIAEVVDGARQLGCRIDYLGEEGFPPIRVHGGGMRGGEAKIHGAINSQYFSSIAISSACAEESVSLVCLDEMTERPYFDITLQMMSLFGVDATNDGYRQIHIPGGQKYAARDMRVEGDYSSASFFFLAAVVCGSRVTVTGLNPETCQGDRAFLDLMERMGCDVSVSGTEVCVQGNPLSAIEADMADIPDLVPPAAIAAAYASGTSRLTNIGHLRHKECDRLGVMVSELAKMGVEASCDDTSLSITGTDRMHGAAIDPHNDHRIAMSFAVAGLTVGDQAIEDEMCVAKSFPDFWERFKVFTD